MRSPPSHATPSRTCDPIPATLIINNGCDGLMCVHMWGEMVHVESHVEEGYVVHMGSQVAGFAFVWHDLVLYTSPHM